MGWRNELPTMEPGEIARLQAAQLAGGDPCGRPGCKLMVFMDQAVPGSATWDGFCSAECRDATAD